MSAWMNNQPRNSSKRLRFDFRTIAFITVALIVGGYQWYTVNNTADKPTPVKPTPETVGSYLEPAGGKNLKSPAGLIYTGGKSEHRSDHVLRHASDIPDRAGSHGVFDANGDDVFRLVDEAYGLVKRNSLQVKTTPAENGKTEYVIDLHRKIGYLGGKTGNRKNNPSLERVKLILADDRVITAYPY